jgi:hypothetical protein
VQSGLRRCCTVRDSSPLGLSPFHHVLSAGIRLPLVFRFLKNRADKIFIERDVT